MARKKIAPSRDWTGWHERFAAAALDKEKFSGDAKAKFLDHFSKFGLKGDAAKAAGVCTQTVNNHIKSDAVFAAAVVECKQWRADRIETQAWHVAIEGVKKPIIGGPDKDQVVAHEIVYATNILAMMMKQSNPEYKEKSEIDLNHAGGGVMLMPAGLTPEQFKQQMDDHNKLHDKEPGSDE